MSRGISEPDWKVFKALHPVALERFCEKILAETRAETERPGKSPHEKYGAIYKLIKDRDREIAKAFDDYRRSTALMQIGIIHSLGLLTADELRRFSPETLRSIEMWAPIPPA